MEKKKQIPNSPEEKTDDLKLKQLLAKELQLQEKLIEALATGRYFITITFQKKYRPDDEHDLQHFWLRRNFMVNDVIPGLKHLAADFIAKENPTAELPADTGFY